MSKKIIFFVLILFLVYPGNIFAAARCGDGVQEGFEECDNGENNSDSTPDACRSNCVRAYCGDGTVDSNEECDDASYGNSDKIPNACRRNCKRAYCGDGVVDLGEDCDDKNDNAYDGCYQCSDCYLPKDDLIITSAPGQTIKLCPGRYELRDEGQDGIIIVNGSGVRVDCSGVTLIGLPPARATAVKPVVGAHQAIGRIRTARETKRKITQPKTPPQPTPQTPSSQPRAPRSWQGTGIMVNATDVVVHDAHIEGFQNGIKLSSSGAVLFNNSLRDNGLDIKSENPQNFGVKNRCSKYQGWTENGRDGCTYSN